MARIEVDLLVPPVAPMPGDHTVATDDADLLDAIDDGDGLMGILGRDRVAVVVEADQGLRIDLGRRHPPGFEALGG